MKQTIFLFTALWFMLLQTSAFAQEKTDFVKDLDKPVLELAINATSCHGGGVNLLVYNPYAKSSLSYASDDYHVQWFLAKGGPVLSTDILLTCVCDGSFTALVTHLSSGRQKSITVKIASCGMTIEPYVLIGKSK